MDNQNQKARAIFEQAVEISDAHERRKFVDSECTTDADLKKLVAELLLANDDAGSFLEGDGNKDNRTRTMDQEPRHTEAEGRDDSALEQVGMVLGGRYELLENIGEGGMGSVWVAKQSQPVKRKVAIKLVKAGMDSKQVLARFESERQALAVMDHPNIAKIFDGGMTDQGRPYFVMEYVKGIPFTEYCDQARLSLKARLELFVPVCQAIQHAHHKGIVHRDLKPSNILICLYDGHPVPKVIDFGLAKALHQPLTEQSIYTGHGMMLGTPLYMSPEQAELNNLDIDTRTDIYSLGVLLYELLTGTTPLERQQLNEAAFDEVLRLIREVEPARPSLRLSGSDSLPSIAAQRRIEPRNLQRSLSGDLDWIVMKALDKERSRRYETANGLAADIERFLSGDAVEACPPSTTYRLRKFVRKNRGLVFAAFAVFAALLAGVTGTTWGLVRARDSAQKVTYALSEVKTERDEKEKARQLATDKTNELEKQNYVMGLQSALRSLQNGELTSARRLLTSVPSRLRGWEWRMLCAESNASLGSVELPENTTVVATTRTGDYAILRPSSEQGPFSELLLMNATTGASVAKIPLPNVEHIYSAALAKDARRIAVLAVNKSGSLRWCRFRGPRGCYNQLPKGFSMSRKKPTKKQTSKRIYDDTFKAEAVQMLLDGHSSQSIVD